MDIDHLSTALALALTDTESLAELGIAFLQQGKSDRAISCLEAVVKQNPQDDRRLYYLEAARKRQSGLD